MAGSLAPPPSLEETVRHLAALSRPSASEGERQAAEWIAARLREAGCEARVERERAHGGYWWPLGLLNAASALAALALRARPRGRGRRALAGAVGALAAAAIWDDVGGGRLWFRRALLPHRSTFNVVAEAGDPEAERTVVLIAHHDAAHSGFVFHPAPGWFVAERLPGLIERSTQTLPILYGVWLGPVALAAGALLGRRGAVTLAALLGAGAAAAMADIGASEVVPGANDNLAAVAVLIALAARVSEEPVAGVRVVLLSTGSEESFMEGMQGYARRHFGELDRERTEMVCLECVGSPHLEVLRGEGMLRMRDYPEGTREGLIAAARAAGVEVGTRLRTVAATDALIALRAGFLVATLAACDARKLPANYHWPSDVPDNVSWDSVRGALAICEAFVRRSAR